MKCAFIFQKFWLLFFQLFSSLNFASAFLSGASSQGSMNALQAGTQSSTDSPSSSVTTSKKNPIDLFGIDHVVLLVDDLDGMTKWYETVLGCKVAKHNKEFQMIHLDAGSSLIDLVDKKGPLGKQGSSDDAKEVEKKLDHICLALYDFDENAIKEHLSYHGVAITTDTGVRYGKGGDGKSLYFEDPEGTRIELKKSRLLK